MIGSDLRFFPDIKNQRKMEIGVALFVGLLLGLMVVFTPFLPLPNNLQTLVYVIPIAITVVILFNNLEKLILFAIAISIPLNLDFSVIVSPYGRNAVNVANGRTIMALTGFRVSLILILVIIGFIIWLSNSSINHHQPIRFFPATSIPALGLICVSILSLFQSEDTQLTFFKITQLIELFLVYFYLANNLQTKQDLQYFIIVLMGGLLAESIFMVVQWRTGWIFSFAGISASIDNATHRAAGTLGSANTAGAILTVQLAISCAMLWLFTKQAQKKFALICLVVGYIALISTAGRAAWGGFIVAIVVFFIVGLRRGWIQLKFVVILCLITLIIVAVFYPFVLNRITEDDNGSASSRLLMFKLAWNMIIDSPSNMFFGVGANNYALVAPSYNSVIGGLMGYTIQDISVHNVYLLMWAELGLIGLLCFLCFLIAPFERAWNHINSLDRFTSIMALGIGCGFLGLCIQMLADPFIARPKMIILYLLVSIIASLDNIESVQGNPQKKENLRF